MSKGSRVVTFRMEEELMTRVDAAIASANLSREDQPYNLSDWLRGAIEAKLAHLSRGKRSRKRNALRAAVAADCLNPIDYVVGGRYGTAQGETPRQREP